LVDTSHEAYMSTMERKKPRKFTPEFKAEAVRLVRETGKPIAQVARDLGMWRSVLDKWVKQARVDDREGPPGELTTDEKQELTRLRQENRELRMERELLKNHLARPAPSVAPETPALVASVDREERPSAFWCS